MIYRLISLLLVATLLIIGLGRYLAPDDLAECEQPGDKCQKADAIVVISGGDTPGRTSEAIKLYKDGWASLVIVSGAAADKTGLSNAEAMKRQVLASGIPARGVIAEESSETTKQNAEEVKKIITSRNMKRIILVTSGYHMRRAQLEFSAQLPGIEVVAHPVSSDKQWGAFWWLTPWGWWLVVGELLRIGVFFIGGSR